VLRAIVGTLGPYVGENMASAAVRMQLEKLGLTGASLFQPEIEELLVALGPGLHVFIGRTTTQHALASVRQVLGLAERGSAP
jgi:hypothetical protein